MPVKGQKLFSGLVPELANARSGIGLRSPHMRDILDQKPACGFLEAHSENYFSIGGIPFEQLMQCRDHFPISLHGVGLSLGAAQGIDDSHLEKLAHLVDAVAPALVSEHVSWSSADNISVPDLLPLPFTDQALDIICANIDKVQSRLKRTILVENPSSYMALEAEMQETDFLSAISERTGCGLLLDINNIAVSAHNLGFNAAAYINALPQGHIGEIHLAGYQDNGTLYIDAHNHAVYDSVWDLYKIALKRFGDIPTLVEWDNDLPALSVLINEAQKADHCRAMQREHHDAA